MESDRAKLHRSRFPARLDLAKVEAGKMDIDLRPLNLTNVAKDVGIAKEDIPKLMQPFMQLDNVYQRKTSGSGLGLFIVRSLVEKHGGTIAIDSAISEGTRITVRLPAKLVTSAAATVCGE